MPENVTPSVAETRLRAMTAASLDPALTDGEVADLLALAAVADPTGRAPTDEGWAPTYHLARAAAEGWRWKAAKCAHRVDATADGGAVSRSQLHAHCLAMARRYAASGGIVAIPLEGVGAYSSAADRAVVNMPEVGP